MSKRKQSLNITKMCLIIIIGSLIVAIIVKSSITIKDIFTGNIQIDISATKDIIFNLCMGLITSAVIGLIIEKSNKQMLLNRNIIIKKAVLKNFLSLVYKMIYELSSGTERDVLSITHNFNHLKFMIDDRVKKLDDYCEIFLKDYIDIFTEEEIILFNNLKSQCKIIINLDTEAWRDYMKLYEKQLERYYYSKVYKDMYLEETDRDRMVIDNVDKLNGIVSENERHIKPILKQLNDIKNKMDYIFKDQY